MALCYGKLRQRVAALGAVPLHHAKGATSPAGHAGEALAAREEEDRNLVKLHVASSCALGFLQDRCGWKKRKKEDKYKTFRLVVDLKRKH